MTIPLYKLTAEKLCPDFQVKRKDCPCENCGFILSELHYIWLEENQPGLDDPIWPSPDNPYTMNYAINDTTTFTIQCIATKEHLS